MNLLVVWLTATFVTGMMAHEFTPAAPVGMIFARAPVTLDGARVMKARATAIFARATMANAQAPTIAARSTVTFARAKMACAREKTAGKGEWNCENRRKLR
jgi:hypothetical protein